MKRFLTALLLVPFALCADGLRITDSSRYGSSALRSAALEYSLKNGKNIRIDRMSGSSAARLLAGKMVDIAVFDEREIPGELKDAPRLMLGSEALVLCVNAKNPLRGVSSKDAREIFSSRRPRWSQYGGIPRDIHRLNLKNAAPNAGLDREIFNITPSLEVLGVNDSQSAAFIVGADTDALAFIHPVPKSGNIKFLEINNISPSPQNIATGKYPFSRRYVAVTVKKSPLADDFLKYLKAQLEKLIREDHWLPCR